MGEIKEKMATSLIDALAYLSLREVPAVDDGESIWIRALAKVMKSNGREEYVLVVKDDNGENYVAKDFGSISSIKKYIEYYPFEYLNDTFIPSFATKKKEERIDYLKKYYYNKDFESMSTKDINKEIVLHAMRMQKKQNEH